jgi:protein-L-isoaspartate O-methyltransferase
MGRLAGCVARLVQLLVFGLGSVIAGPSAAQETEQAPFITTPDEVAIQMLRFAGVGPADTVVDLGSGDGRIVISAAREFGARGIGIEIEPRLVSLSRERARAAGVEDRAAFVHGDVLLAQFSAASVVTVYLLPSLIDRLQPRLLDELAPGARIVSHAFAMKGWKPDRTLTVRLSRPHEGQGDASTLHLWVVPAKVRGQWRETGGSANTEGWRLTVHQNFQELEIEAATGNKPIGVRDAKLEGRRLIWETEAGMRFDGEVREGRMTGYLVGNGTRRPLELQRLR